MPATITAVPADSTTPVLVDYEVGFDAVTDKLFVGKGGVNTQIGGGVPAAHATSHQSGGSDPIKLDDLATPDDNTDLNATISAHGLLPKLGGGATNYLRADGTWAAPPAAGSAGGDLAGTYPNPTVTHARGLRETGGPTTLPIGAISAGHILKQAAGSIVGAFLTVSDLPLLNGFTDATPAAADRFPFYDASAAANRDCSAAQLLALAVPAGSIFPFGGTTIPTDFLECDGAAVSRASYPDLFTAIGTTWGAGNGTTTFNLPDLRGRTPIGVGTGTGLTARTLGGTGGTETHTLSTAEMPAHSHNYALTDNTGGGADTNPAKGNGNNPVVIGVSSTGSTSAHANMQPWAATKFIIKT